MNSNSNKLGGFMKSYTVYFTYIEDLNHDPQENETFYNEKEAKLRIKALEQDNSSVEAYYEVNED
jgi:hypothetical protein